MTHTSKMVDSYWDAFYCPVKRNGTRARDERLRVAVQKQQRPQLAVSTAASRARRQEM